MRRSLQLTALGLATILGVELMVWLAVARERLEARAWVALVATYAGEMGREADVSCVSVEPALYERTSQRDRAALASLLAKRGVQLVVAPPTRSPTGYLDRDCVEIFSAPEGLEGINLPVLAQANIAYYSYDFNGDALLMLQVGPTWVYVTHWHSWI